ncbi:protein translocase subunit SecD [Candidatus Peregrinibacteria bacterium]|nr:protein translocase subunit SecD [Candidatus Peregrinibacteria bacterium]
MSSKRLLFWPIVTVVIAMTVAIIALPQQWKGWAPGFLKSPALHLGLDLVGGTQLDFRISEQEINDQERRVTQELADAQKRNAPAAETQRLQAELTGINQQKQNLVEAIRTVLERRINALGVSEATITPSYVGSEKHLLVECPGVVDTQECIKVVGKTIQLEFKEEFTTATQDFVASVHAKAEAALRRVTQSGQTLRTVGQDHSDQLGVFYQDAHTVFRDQLPKGLEDVWTQAPGKVVLRDGSVITQQPGAQGQPQEQTVPGVFVLEVTKPATATGRVLNEAPKAFALLAKSETGAIYAFHDSTSLDAVVNTRIAGSLRALQPGDLKSVSMEDGSAHLLFLRHLLKGTQVVAVSHILVSYKGASKAPASVTRTKDQAFVRAQELKARLDAGAAFTQLARRESDGPSAKQGGSLGEIAPGEEPPSFDQVAFHLAPGNVSNPVETQFGYHLIRVDKAAATKPDNASYDDLTITGTNALPRADGLIRRLKSGGVRSQEPAIEIRSLFFSLVPTGWKDTALDGKHFRTAAVSLDPVTNIPVVQIAFDDEGAKLFQELTKANISKRIAIFVGGQLVSAPVVQQEIAGGLAVITGSQGIQEAQRLAQDLNTGAIPAPIHLVGQYTVEATLGSAALKTSLQAALVGTIALMLYMILIYRFLGVVADAALLIYAVLLFALLKLPFLRLFGGDFVVLTLAGMAGIILSIGMAVDANVLVFERMKEELRKGKMVKTAVETSFKHAWPAIRDSNVSTIITCGILFTIGTSIVRGFAVTLGIGVFLSLFTSVTITRWMLRKVAMTTIAENRRMFGVAEVGGASDVPDDH